jgi:hypothetical protein
VLLAELAHVERDQRALVVEQELGERLGELGLSDARGAGEDERAAGTLRVLEAGALTTDRRLRAAIASSWPMTRWCSAFSMKTRRLVSSSVSLKTGMPVACASTSAIRPSSTTAWSRRRRCATASRGAGARRAASPRRAGPRPSRSPAPRWRLLLLADLGDLLVELAQLRRARQDRQAQARAGLVDQVDRLVGQEPVADVAVGEVRRGDDRAVGDLHLVVRLVAVAQPLEDVDRVGQARLGDLDRLEAALERGVLLEVLAVLVERRGADRLQLAAGEQRLQDRGRVDRALGGTRTDEGVDLVDEDDDVAARADLLGDLLQALLEVTAVAEPAMSEPRSSE